MKMLIKLFMITVLVISTCPLVFANNSQQYENKAIQFLEALKTEQPEKLYSFFSDELKKEATLEQLQPLVLQIKRFVNNAEDIKLIKGESNVRGPNSYGLIYTFSAKGIPYEYDVHLIEKDEQVLIRGFDFFARVPDRLFSFRYATYKHYLVFSFFIACILVEIACLLFFIFKRGIKRRWLYICSAFVGAPVGVGINWITGALTISFGFYIPAVRAQWPVSNPNMPSIFVFFPLGVIFLMNLLVSDRKKCNSTEHNILVQDPDKVKEDIN